MTSRSILQVFENYQKSRLAFAQTISDLAARPQNVEVMKSAHVLDLLKPLITDGCPQIKQCASIAIGRLVHNDEEMAEELLDVGLLTILLHNAGSGNKYQKTAVLFVLRSICKHNERMAEAVIKNGGLQTLVYCLEDFEPTVKESAAWGIGYIARHSRKLAQECVNAGVLPLLMLALQEPELGLKQISTSAVMDIAKHCEDLALGVVDAGIVPYLAKNLSISDEKLKRQCLAALSAIAKHSSELAEVVVEADIFPAVLQLLAHPCPGIRRNAACLIRDVSKQSLELTQLVVNTGGIVSSALQVGVKSILLSANAARQTVIAYLKRAVFFSYVDSGHDPEHPVGALIEVLFQPHPKEPDPLTDDRLPCISAIGFISGQSSQLAMTVLGCRIIQVLARIVHESTDDGLLTVTIWTIGQIGKHSPEHSAAVASANLFPRLIYLYENPESSLDLKTKCQTSLKLCLQNCLLVTALEPLLSIASPEVMKYVLGQYSKVLPNDPKARRTFVTSGGLKKIQQIDAKPGSTMMEYITVINSCFPEEIVKFYSPGYPDTLLDKVEQYAPQLMTVLRETDQTNAEIQTEIVKAVTRDDLSSESDTAIVQKQTESEQ